MPDVLSNIAEGYQPSLSAKNLQDSSGVGTTRKIQQAVNQNENSSVNETPFKNSNSSQAGANIGNNISKTSTQNDIYIPSILKKSAQNKNNTDTYDKNGKVVKKDTNSQSAEASKSATTGQKKLSQAEQKKVDELKKIDQNVKSHEQAHKSAGGGLVRGAASFTYVQGPDGNQYAVGGEVQIDMSYDLNKPEETITKMEQVKAAALAPADPSSQDRSVASEANSIENQARAVLSQKKTGNIAQIAGSFFKTNAINKYKVASNNSGSDTAGQYLNLINSNQSGVNGGNNASNGISVNQSSSTVSQLVNSINENSNNSISNQNDNQINNYSLSPQASSIQSLIKTAYF